MKAFLSSRAESSSPNDQAVERYLRAHPEFFVEHPELLEVLTVPHRSGTAVSLVARQLEVFREKNRRLTSQLDELLRIARDNDTLHQRLHRLTLNLIDARGIPELLERLRGDLTHHFLTDFVAVRVLEPCNMIAGASGAHLDEAARNWCEALLTRDEPVCGPLAPEAAVFLFGDQAPAVASHAAIGLAHGPVSGVLAVGSRDAERFHPDMGFLYLRQMGEVLAARLAHWAESIG